MENKTYTISDEVIVKIIEILQQGMIEAKDVTQDFRTLALTTSGNKLVLVKEQST